MGYASIWVDFFTNSSGHPETVLHISLNVAKFQEICRGCANILSMMASLQYLTMVLWGAFLASKLARDLESFIGKFSFRFPRVLLRRFKSKKEKRGRCYDNKFRRFSPIFCEKNNVMIYNFRRFSPIFGEKIGVFLKNHWYDPLFAEFGSVFESKYANFFAEFLGENILKNLTLVPRNTDKEVFFLFFWWWGGGGMGGKRPRVPSHLVH
jgi:hypothetical protein